MSARQDIINLFVNVNGDKAKNELNDLRKTSADLKKQIVDTTDSQKLLKKEYQLADRAYTASVKEFGYHSEKTKAAALDMRKAFENYQPVDAQLKQLKTDLQGVEGKMAATRKEIGLASLSLKELYSDQRKLNSLLASTTFKSADYKQYAKQLEEVNAQINKVKGGVSGFSSVFSKSAAELGGLAAGYLGFTAVVSGIKSLYNGTIKLSDQLGDLRRVAGLTKDEANNLNKSLLQIDTRTSGAGLLSIAIIAGKLGVAKEDIVSFTAAVDKLVITLGDELGDADQITTQLGKILNVFDGKVTGENISFLGNAIVDLANKGVATGGFIVDFTQRVSGIAKASNLSLAATLGLAAGFESLGLRSESSATAMQKLLSTIAADIPKAAKIAGVPVKEFNELFANSPQEALIKYAEGLVKNKKSFSEITASFKDAGEEGARVVQTLQAIAQQGDYLRKQIDISNKSITEQNALNEGAAIKQENLAGSIEKLGKAWDRLIANNKVTQFFTGLVGVLSGAVDGVNKLIDSFDSFEEKRNKANAKANKDQIDFSGEVVKGMSKKTLDEQQKLADSYKAIYIQSRKELSDFLNSSDKDNLARRRQLVNQVAQDGRIFIATQRQLQKELPKLKNDTQETTSKSVTAATSTSSKNSEYDRLKKEAADFYKQLEQLKKDAENASKSDDEKELIALEEKYNALHAKAQDFFKKNVIDRKTYTAEEKLIVEAFNNDLAALQKKQFDANSSKEYAQSLKASDDYFAEQKRNVERNYAEGKISKEDYEKSLAKIEGLAIKNRIQISVDYSSTVKKAAADVKTFTVVQEDFITKNLQHQNDLRIAILQDEAKARRDIRNIQINDPTTTPKKRNELQKQNAEEDKAAGIADLKSRLKEAGLAYDDATVNATEEGKAIWLKYTEDLKKADLELQQARIASQEWWSNEALNLTSNLIDALNNLDQRELQKEKAKNDAKKNLYQQQLNAKLISQKQYDKKVAEADAEMDKKKHEADVKAFKRKQALGIADALVNGVIAIEKTYAEFGFPLGTPFAIAMGLVTLANVAAIASQAPPEAAEGNWFREGDKHSDPSGGIPVMIERNEAVVKADAMTDSNEYTVSGTPAQITSKLNSMHGGVNWAGGATMMPKFREPAPQINPKMVRIMAQGGLGSGATDSSNSKNAELLKVLILKQDELITEVKNQKEKLHAVVSIKEYRETERKYDSARKAAGMGG